LGYYERWQQTKKQYNLKWSIGNDSLQALERFFNPEMSQNHMIDKVKQMIHVAIGHVQYCQACGIDRIASV
jgi:hypothetical protein